MSHECKGCRTQQVLIYHIRGMGYCGPCYDKGRAPTHKQLDEYLNPEEYREVAAKKSHRRFGAKENRT